MKRKLWMGLFVISLICLVAYSALAQASPAPSYDLYANDDRYALAVTCHGGTLRLWVSGQAGQAGQGILFCEGETETPTETAFYTAEPLDGSTSTPVPTKPVSTVWWEYFPLLSK